MTELLGLLGLAGLGAGLTWLIVSLINKTGKKIPIALMAIGFVLFIIASPRYFEQVWFRVPTTSLVMQSAEQSMLRRFPEYSSADIVSREIFEDKKSSDSQESHHFLVLMKVEVENDAGDVVQKAYLVWVRHMHRVDKYWGDTVKGVREVSIPPTEEEVATIKSLVHWPDEE